MSNLTRKSLADSLHIIIPQKESNKITLEPRVTQGRSSINTDYDRKVKMMSDGVTRAVYDSNILGDTSSTKIQDGFFGNPVMGIGSYDTALNAGQFQLNMVTFNRQEILAVYHSSWIFRRIIDKMSQDMWSKGIDIQGEVDPEDLTRIYRKLNRLSSSLIYATQQCRLFGGAASLIMVDDGETDLTKPLNRQNIKKGSIVRIETTDRWWGLEPSTELVSNYKNPDYGTPKYYTFDFQNSESRYGRIKAHHSRVLRWVNRKTSRMLNTMLMGWGLSELEHLYQDILGHETTKNAINSLLDKSLLEIVKVRGMRSLMSGLAGGNINEQIRLTGALSGLNSYRSINSLVLLDTEDDYQRFEYSFSGLSDILETQKDTLAGGAEMPKVLLYGDTKGGLTSDSPAELVFYDQTIRGKQDQICRPQLDKLLPILFASEGIKYPANLDYEFVSLINVGTDQKLNHLQGVINATTTLLENGLITHDTAIKEIQQIQKQTDFGSNIGDDDLALAKRNDEAEKEMPSDEESITEEEQQDINTNDKYEQIEVSDKIVAKNKKLLDKLLKRSK